MMNQVFKRRIKCNTKIQSNEEEKENPRDNSKGQMKQFEFFKR